MVDGSQYAYLLWTTPLIDLNNSQLFWLKSPHHFFFFLLNIIKQKVRTRLTWVSRRKMERQRQLEHINVMVCNWKDIHAQVWKQIHMCWFIQLPVLLLVHPFPFTESVCTYLRRHADDGNLWTTCLVVILKCFPSALWDVSQITQCNAGRHPLLEKYAYTASLVQTTRERSGKSPHIPWCESKWGLHDMNKAGE